MICIQCSREFEAKRTDTKFCSAKCRVTANRVTDKSVTDNPTNVVTDKVSVQEFETIVLTDGQLFKITKTKPTSRHTEIIGTGFEGIRNILDYYKPEEITKELLDEIDPNQDHNFVPNWMRNGIDVREQGLI